MKARAPRAVASRNPATRSASGFSRSPNKAAWMPPVMNTTSIPGPTAPRTSVSMPSPMARTVGRRRCGRKRAEASQRGTIDLRKRLADDDGLAAGGAIALGERAGAPDQTTAALNDDVGIEAEHRQTARPPTRKARSVVVGRLGGVVVEPRTGHQLRLLLATTSDGQAVVERQVAIRPDMKDPHAGRSASSRAPPPPK